MEAHTEALVRIQTIHDKSASGEMFAGEPRCQAGCGKWPCDTRVVADKVLLSHSI